MLFSEIKNCTEYETDRACCTVVASSVAFNQDFTHTQEYYNSNGRRRNHALENGLSYRLIKTYARKVGGKVERLYPKDITGGATLTVGNSKKYLNKTQNYIMFSSGHAIGVKNGVVQDWSAGSKRPVKVVFAITPPLVKEVIQAITKFKQLKLF
jgi:hypothetical protein